MIHLHDVLGELGPDSDLRSLLYQQLPRSRTVGAMIRHDAILQQSEHEDARDETQYNSVGWMILLTFSDEATRNR